MDVLMCTASIWHMATISVDRYCSLRFPLRYRRTRTPVFCIAKIAFVWVVSVGICSPLAIAGFVNPLNVYRNGQCAVAVPDFVIYGSIFAFFVPLVLMLVTYSLTVRTLTQYVAWKRRESNVSGQPGGMHLQAGPTDDDGDARVAFSASLTASSVRKAHATPMESFDDETCNNNSQRIRRMTWPQRWAARFARPEGNGKGKDARRAHVSTTATTTLEDTAIVNRRHGENARVERMDDHKAPKPAPMAQILRDSCISDSQANCGDKCVRSAAATGCETQKNDDNKDGDDAQRRRQHSVGYRRNLRCYDDDKQRQNTTTLRSVGITTENHDEKVVGLPNDSHRCPTGMNTPTYGGRPRQAARKASFATQTRRRKRKATRVLGVIFVAFIVLWTPFFVLNILSAVCPHCVESVSSSVWTVLVWLGWVSSLANPVIYTSFSPAFRSAFRRLLTCHCSRRKSLAKRRQQQWTTLLKHDNRIRYDSR